LLRCEVLKQILRRIRAGLFFRSTKTFAVSEQQKLRVIASIFKAPIGRIGPELQTGGTISWAPFSGKRGPLQLSTSASRMDLPGHPEPCNPLFLCPLQKSQNHYSRPQFRPSESLLRSIDSLKYAIQTNFPSGGE